MNVQKISVLLEALRYGSLNRAAEELGYTQSGLTYIINTIENDLGLPIVIRDSNGIRLSGEGQELLPALEALVTCDKHATEQVSEILSRQDGVLNVASYPSTAYALLPAILADFAIVAPDVKVNVRVGSRDEIFAWLMSGMVDFGFGGQMQIAGCKWLPLMEDPELAVLPLDFATEGMTAFPMENFKDHPFVHPVYWAEEAEMAQQVERYGIEAKYAVDYGDNAPIIAMVGRGIGLSALPELTLRYHAFQIKTLPIDPPCKRLLGVNYREQKEGASAARKFLRCLKKQAKLID